MKMRWKLCRQFIAVDLESSDIVCVLHQFSPRPAGFPLCSAP
jgi:hypothetical protein